MQTAPSDLQLLFRVGAQGKRAYHAGVGGESREKSRRQGILRQFLVRRGKERTQRGEMGIWGNNRKRNRVRSGRVGGFEGDVRGRNWN